MKRYKILDYFAPLLACVCLFASQNTLAATDPHSDSTQAQTKSGDSDSSLAAKATNPIANLMQFQFQNTFNASKP